MLLMTGFALGCLATVFVIVMRDFWSQPVARVFSLMLVAGSGVLINPLLPTEWKWLAADMMTAVPALFWLLCQVAFSYRPRLISIWGAIALYSFIPPAIVRSIDPAADSLWITLGWNYPRYAEYLLTVHGLWTVIANWKDDLVESRRTLRGVILGAVGSLVLVIIISMNTGYILIPVPVLIGVSTLIVALFLLRGREGILLGPAPVSVSVSGPAIADGQESEPPKPVVIEPQPLESEHGDGEEKLELDLQPYVIALDELMRQGYYRTEKLTIKALAQKLELPEYKTRALINQSLGYRNFNEYINRLRVDEAAQRLIDEPDTPVLNISLDVGYRTLSSFNRAFKDQMECSPSEYRTQKQGSGR